MTQSSYPTMMVERIEEDIKYALRQLNNVGLKYHPKNMTMLTVKSILERTLQRYEEIRCSPTSTKEDTE